MSVIIEAEARLRAKNQITVPEAIVATLEAQLDDTLIFEADASEPGIIRVRLLPRSFAGALTSVYGSAADVKALVEEERAAWE